jgi:hypothetical protein
MLRTLGVSAIPHERCIGLDQALVGRSQRPSLGELNIKGTVIRSPIFVNQVRQPNSTTKFDQVAPSRHGIESAALKI